MYVTNTEISCGVLSICEFPRSGTPAYWLKEFLKAYKEFHTGENGDSWYGACDPEEMPYEQVIFSNVDSATYRGFMERLKEYGRVIKTPLTFNANHPERPNKTIQSAFFIPGAKLKREVKALIEKQKARVKEENDEF